MVCLALSRNQLALHWVNLNMANLVTVNKDIVSSVTVNSVTVSLVTVSLVTVSLVMSFWKQVFKFLALERHCESLLARGVLLLVSLSNRLSVHDGKYNHSPRHQ